MRRVLVLGGGFGGLSVATELARRKLSNVEITLVEQRPNYVMGLAKLWALDGRRPLDAGRRSYADLEKSGIRFVRGVVRSIDLASRSVRVDANELSYDHLVVALGAEMAPEKLPGFAPHMDLYTEAGVEHLRHQLESFSAGRIVVMIAGLPFKCPPAPYEAALLVESMLRRRGVRKGADIRLTTPEPYPMPVAPPEYGDRLAEFLKLKGIEYVPKHVPTSIDAKGQLIHYENGAKVPFDVLLGVPLHRAPQVVRDAGLTDETGWIPVDASSLRSNRSEVWAVGDTVAIRLPNGKLLPKAGTLAANEGHVVAQHIVAELDGKPSTASFDGRGVCYIETGDGAALPGRGSFFASPNPTFEFGTPSPKGLHEKEQFESEFMQRWFGPRPVP